LRVADNQIVKKGAAPHGHAVFAFSSDSRLLAVSAHGGNDSDIRCIEMATGLERCRFPGHRGKVRALAFSPDGRTLASGSKDTTILTWNVRGTQLPVKPPDKDKLEQWWTDLGEKDAKRAHEAICLLIAVPRLSVALLRQKIQPAKGIDSQALERLIADLDSSQPNSRAAAMQQLEKLRELALPALKKALKETKSAEVRRRIEIVLEKHQERGFDAGATRTARAIEVLELIGDPEARASLQELSKGAEAATATREAMASLVRLSKRR